jgi:hypothetical protein
VRLNAISLVVQFSEPFWGEEGKKRKKANKKANNSIRIVVNEKLVIL